MTTTLADAIGGKNRVIGGPFGSNLTQKDYQDDGVPVIRGGNMGGVGRSVQGPFAYVSVEKFERDLASNAARPGDIIVTQRGTLGQVAILPDDAPYPHYVVSQSQMAVRVDRTKADRDFVYYFLTSPVFNDYIGVTSIQTGVPHINLGLLRDVEVDWPLPAEQRAIAATLGALDDKIELNRKMNATLEAMARALFRDWFVDFGPTRAKMEARAPYLSPDLWSLFPDRLDDEGKPEGWEKSNLASILTVLETGRRPKGGVAGISGGVPSVGAESIDGVGKFDFGKTKFVSEEFFSNMAKGHVSKGDVLIYKDGGKPGELRPSVSYVSNGFPFDRFCINEHVFRTRSDRVDQAFLYCLLSTDEAFAQMRELATGVAQPGLNQVQMGRLSFVLPKDKALLDHSASILKTLIDACNVNASESRTLAQTRDLLLPRLMSGEIQLKDLEDVS